MRIIPSLALIDLRLLEVKFLFYDCTIAYSLLNWNEWHNTKIQNGIENTKGGCQIHSSMEGGSFDRHYCYQELIFPDKELQ